MMQAVINELRRRSLNQIFASTPLQDRCIDAANRATKSFDSAFPGWPLYARIVRGERFYDRTLKAWAILCTRGLARAVQINGHTYLNPGCRSLHAEHSHSGPRRASPRTPQHVPAFMPAVLRLR